MCFLVRAYMYLHKGGSTFSCDHLVWFSVIRCEFNKRLAIVSKMSKVLSMLTH